MTEFFAANARLIIFLHVFFAVVWIGGMIAIRFSMHRGISMLREPKERLQTTIFGMERFLLMASVAVFVMLLTGIIMMLALKGSPLYSLTHVKSAILTVMAVVFFLVFIKHQAAKKAFLGGDIQKAAASLRPLATFLIPTNIALGVIEIIMGVALRGF